MTVSAVRDIWLATMVYEYFRARPSALTLDDLNFSDLIPIILNIDIEWHHLEFHLDIVPERPEIMHWHRLRALSVDAHALLRTNLCRWSIWNSYHTGRTTSVAINPMVSDCFSPLAKLPPWLVAKVLVIAAESPRFKSWEWLI